MSYGGGIKGSADGLMVQGLGQTFHQAGRALAVLKGADLTVRPGEYGLPGVLFLVEVGHSGRGIIGVGRFPVQ